MMLHQSINQLGIDSELLKTHLADPNVPRGREGGGYPVSGAADWLNKPLIISNSCIGTYYYVDMSVEMQTMFSYSSIPKTQLEQLINNLYTINFDNVEFDIVESNRNFASKNYIHAIIDGWLDVHFIHYNGIEIDSRIQQYFRHLQRMKYAFKQQRFYFAFYFNTRKNQQDFYFIGENEYDFVKKLLAYNNVYVFSTDSKLVHYLNNEQAILVDCRTTQQKCAMLLRNKVI